MPKRTLRIPYKPPSPRKCRDCGMEVRKPDLREARAKQIDTDTFLCPFCVLTAGPKLDEAPPQLEGTARLREIKNARQIPGEPARRWFTNGNVDLIVWLEKSSVIGYQLIVPSSHDQAAITWHAASGFSISAVDDGEGRPARHKMTPLLTVPACINFVTVIRLFGEISDDLPHGIASLVEQTLLDAGDMKKRTITAKYDEQ